MDDPFVASYSENELAIAGEFLTNWLPFLTRDLCDSCSVSLRSRVGALSTPEQPDDSVAPREEISGERSNFSEAPIEPTGEGTDHEGRDHEGTDKSPEANNSVDAAGDGGEGVGYALVEPSGWGTDHEESPKPRMSWADMAQEDEFEELLTEVVDSEKLSSEEKAKKTMAELSRADREHMRFTNVGRKKDFMCFERVKGKLVNILDGLELHTGIFSAAEQKRIVDFVFQLQEKERNGQLGARTCSQQHKWMQCEGTVAFQFGCCYNITMDKNGNPPGILRDVVADPIPSLFKMIIKRLIRWHVLPTTSVPDSCIVNICEPGDGIPPLIHSHDFLRPFATVTFLSECHILFSSELKVDEQGDFNGAVDMPLPVGSVLVFKGNAADVAQHCIPPVPTKRISITFSKMEESKRQFGFTPEPDLQSIQPLLCADPEIPHPPQPANGWQQQQQSRSNRRLSSSRRNSQRGSDVSIKPESNTSGYGRPVRQFTTDSYYNNADSDRRRGSAARQQEPLHVADLRQILSRPFRSQQAEVEEGSGESFGRTVRMQQNRIVISKNIQGGRDSSHSNSRYPESDSSGPRIRTIRGRRITRTD